MSNPISIKLLAKQCVPSVCVAHSASATRKRILGPSLNSASHTRAVVSAGSELQYRPRYLQSAQWSHVTTL